MSSTAAQSPPVEPPASRADARVFEADGVNWIAWVAGAGASGAGRHGRAMVVSIFFARADEPDVPLREALLARGRIDGLYPEELVSLLRQAVSLPPVESRP